jgi:fused signal recognition particle receptor
MSDQALLLIGALAGVAVVAFFALALKARRRRDRAEMERLDGGAAAPRDEDREPEPEGEAAPEPVAAPAREVAKPVAKPIPKGRSYADGLLKTREQGFVSRLGRLFSGRPIDAAMLTEIEEVLLTADIGVKTATRLMEDLDRSVRGGDATDADRVWSYLRGQAQQAFERVAVAEPDDPACGHAPHVILVAGVNGSGKTTTLGKLAWRYCTAGKRVHLVAGDTFRAAAEDQLQVWAERAGAGFFRGVEGADPAAVAFEGVRAARDAGAEIILVDTAGRLHTKTNLVEELKKVHRVCGKVVDDAPHETFLVLDGTNGQNAIQQALTFREAIPVSGVILTKLDGTAKGGVAIGLAEELGLPIRYVGIGERPEDLRPFDAAEFVSALFPSAS